MKHLHRTVIAIVAVLGVLFVGVAVAQDVPEPEPLPANTFEECEAIGGAWFDECFEPEALYAWLEQEELAAQQSGDQAPTEAAPAPSPAQPAPATQAQPQYTG